MFKKMIIVLLALFTAGGMFAEGDDVIWKIPMPRIVKDIQLTPDEKYLTVTDESATPKLLDANDGSLIREYVGLNGQQAHDVSSDGKLIVSTGFIFGEAPNQLLSSIKIWDLNSGELIKTLLEDEKFDKTYNGIDKVKFSVDGRFLFCTAACKDQKNSVVLKWDTKTWELLNTSSCMDIELIAMSPNGDIFATAGVFNEPAFITLWDVETLKPFYSLGSLTTISGLIFSADGMKLGSSGGHGALKVWNVEDKSLINEFSLGQYMGFGDLVFSSDSKYIIVRFGGIDTSGNYVYNLETNQLVYTYQESLKASSLDITDDSKYLYVSIRKTIRKLHARFETTSVKYESEFTSSNSPNPFADHTSIQFYLNKPGDATVAISDNNGNEIDVLLNSFLDVGKHNVDWNSSKFPSGIYYCNIICGAYRETIKLTLQR